MSEIYLTNNNIEVPAVSEAQMREIDRIAIEETGPNLFQMMENAGRNLALQTIEILGNNWQQARIIVLAGTGGNGGGGICAARHLANRGANIGLAVTDTEKLNEVAAWQHHIYSATPGNIVQFDDVFVKKPDIIIDALIGYSLRSAPHGKVGELIQRVNVSETLVLSLDIPSGIDSSTGASPGIHVKASQTMTLALPKIGLKNPAAGELVLADIAIPVETFTRVGIHYTNPFDKTYRVPIQRCTSNQ